MTITNSRWRTGFGASTDRNYRGGRTSRGIASTANMVCSFGRRYSLGIRTLRGLADESDRTAGCGIRTPQWDEGAPVDGGAAIVDGPYSYRPNPQQHHMHQDWRGKELDPAERISCRQRGRARTPRTSALNLARGCDRIRKIAFAQRDTDAGMRGKGRIAARPFETHCINCQARLVGIAATPVWRAGS